MKDVEVLSGDEIQEGIETIKERSIQFLELVTGAAMSKPQELCGSVGRIAQSLFAGKLFECFTFEVNSLRDKGKIADSFLKTNQSQMCLIEMLRMLEEEIPDPERFELMKKIYIVTAAESGEDHDNLISLQFMQIARGMKSGEMVLLFAVNRLRNKEVQSSLEMKKWMTKESGLIYEELTEKYLVKLIEKNILRDNGYFNVQRNEPKFLIANAMTSLGKAFCEYISKYDKLNE